MKKYFTTLNFVILFCAFLSSGRITAQLGFCIGNSGDPIFTETFGTGTAYGPALPAGTTNYDFVSFNAPQDGEYTVGLNTFGNGWNLPSDHTPGDTNGKALIVNASFTAGEFYSTPINGLCENTTYEFSSWLINILPNSGCGGAGIPVNVKFEIWDISDTNLLASGDTGNIFSATTPFWQQYALVFQTLPGEVAVILKMINNGIGGCGNDLAIDDIVFKSCGDFISINDTSSNNNITICSSQTPYSTTLTVTPDNSVFSTHFYQWQESIDGITWSDIPSETAQSISISGITTTSYFRAKVAESASNLNNSLCNVTSDVFQVTVDPIPSAPTIECWEATTFNATTCTWEITGTQPNQPTIVDCWDNFVFNTITCLWDNTGTQPIQPTIVNCWDNFVFNTTTCVWDNIGSQAAQPSIVDCWDNFAFNQTTCIWDNTGTQPTQPNTVNCWDNFVFNTTTCVWDNIGSLPNQPTLECWEIAIFNNSTCLWEVSGTQATEPVIECWETRTFNNTTCLWDITGEQPIIESVSSVENSIIVITSNTGDFLYSIDGINFQSNNTFENVENGLYTIYVKVSGCIDIVTTEHLHFYIPQFFTPNNDGENDTFDLKGIENYSSSEVSVYDRFGKVLKTTKNTSFSWDGIYDNSPLPSSDYWYVIIIEGERRVGHFTLKR